MDRDQSAPLLGNREGSAQDELSDGNGGGGGLCSDAIVYRANALNGTTALTVQVSRVCKRRTSRSLTSLSQTCGIAFLALIWSLVLSVMPLHPLPLFGYHPMIQSFAFLLLLQSILTLQPTSHDNPTEKQRGFRVHRAFNLALVLPLFTAGATIMWYLHDQPGQRHFISWHGILGTALIVWTWLQVAAGIAATSFDGKLVGGMDRAKSLWKWHRLSGYILLPAFAFVLYLGAAHTSWSQQNANLTHHVLVIVSLIGVLIGVIMRMNRDKLPKFNST